MVCVDWEYLLDCEEQRDIARSGMSVFAGTIYHIACLVKNRVPVYVVQCFVERCGAPGIVVVDQGGEFESRVVQACEEMEVDVRITGPCAGRQQGLVEQHGGLLG